MTEMEIDIDGETVVVERDNQGKLSVRYKYDNEVEELLATASVVTSYSKINADTYSAHLSDIPTVTFGEKMEVEHFEPSERSDSVMRIEIRAVKGQ